MVPLFSRSNQLVLFWTPRWFQVSACKLPDTLVGLNVDDWLGGLVVVDGPPVLPNFINNVFTIIAVILGINMQYLCFAFYMQVTWCTSWFECSLCSWWFSCQDGPPIFSKFMNNVFTIITLISGISMLYSYCVFCMQVTWYTSWFDSRWSTWWFSCHRWSSCFP